LAAGVGQQVQRAERADLISSATEFIAARDLRNRFAHDYTNKPAALAALLDAAHDLVPFLARTQQRLAAALGAA